MPESKDQAPKKPELTPEELKAQAKKAQADKAAADKAAAEKKAQEDKAAAEKAQAERIRAAQTRTEKNKDKKEIEVKSNLLPEPKERHLFHVEIEKPAFDQKTGERQSKPVVQAFSKNEFKQFEANASTLGYTMKILWNPTKYQQ